MWDRLVCVTPPAPVVDVPALKVHLNAEGFDDDDDLIDGYIAAAQATIVGPRGIGIALAASTWRLSLDEFPAAPVSGVYAATHPGAFLRRPHGRHGPEIILPLGPVTAIASITYVDPTGAQQTLDPAAYMVDLDRRPARIVPALGTTFPATRCQPGAVKITFEAGDANAPADLVQAIKLLVGHWFNNREAVIADNRAAAVVLPFAVDAILERYRDHAL